jgi:hypothetical protein
LKRTGEGPKHLTYRTANGWVMADYEIFPSIIPEEEFVDDSYTKEELDRMDRNELQQIASKHESDDVNGKMSNEEIKDFMEGQKRV